MYKMHSSKLVQVDLVSVLLRANQQQMPEREE